MQWEGKKHFVTFGTLHKTMLSPALRTIVFECCLVDNEQTIDLDIAVVMPNHVHMMFTPLTDLVRMQVCALPDVLCAIKRVSAHRINKLLGRRGPVWREESFDHVIRSDIDANDKFNYIYANPVRAGLVDEPEKYRWLWVNAKYL
jgi:REP element-mobilizing transposase RayT